MKKQEAHDLVARIPQEMPQVRVAIERSRFGRDGNGFIVKCLLTTGQKVIRLYTPDQWPSVKQVWSLFV